MQGEYKQKQNVQIKITEGVSGKIKTMYKSKKKKKKMGKECVPQ